MGEVKCALSKSVWKVKAPGKVNIHMWLFCEGESLPWMFYKLEVSIEVVCVFCVIVVLKLLGILVRSATLLGDLGDLGSIS